MYEEGVYDQLGLLLVRELDEGSGSGIVEVSELETNPEECPCGSASRGKNYRLLSK